MNYSKEYINSFFKTILFNEVLPEISLDAHNNDVQQKINKFTSFCSSSKYGNKLLKGRGDGYPHLQGYAGMFNLYCHYHDTFGTKRFSKLPKEEREKAEQIYKDWGLNLDYDLQYVLDDIILYDIPELVNFFYDNQEIFSELISELNLS
uniref:Uncharacterized protein n=1 Tax=viral metagenome TaxID=1070528 RepID=A0A6C0ISI8_9ZZZZ